MKSIGRGAVLLLNIAPNKLGKIDEKIKNNVREFVDKIHNEFLNELSDELEIHEKINNGGKEILININNPKEIDLKYLVLQENIRYGSRFIEGFVYINDERVNINSIGYKRIIELLNSKIEGKKIHNIKVYFKGASELKIKPIKIY